MANNIGNITSQPNVISYGPYNGRPLTTISGLPTNKTLWSDIFVCVTRPIVHALGFNGNATLGNYNITYNQSSGVVTISSTSPSNIKSFGAYEAYVYVIS